MGGRSIAELKQLFPIDRAAMGGTANSQINPTQEVAAIIHHSGENVLVKLHWGLVPSWAKVCRPAKALINARLETIATKPSFRDPLRRRRCLILSDGFFERIGPKGNRQTVLVTLTHGNPFVFAGLWDSWSKGVYRQHPYRSCTIITAAACPTFVHLHHRMPVILSPKAYDHWLDPRLQDTSFLEMLLRERREEEFVCRRLGAALPNGGAHTQLKLDF